MGDPRGQTATTRNDTEVLFDDLPGPIDLEIDLKAAYCTGLIAATLHVVTQ